MVMAKSGSLSSEGGGVGEVVGGGKRSVWQSRVRVRMKASSSMSCG